MDRSKDTARATRDGLWARLQEQYKGWSEEVMHRSAVCEVCRVKLTGFIALVNGQRVICYDCACSQKVFVDDKVACIVPGCQLPGDHAHENVDPAGETFAAVVKEVGAIPQPPVGAEAILQLATSTLYERGRHYTTDKERNMGLVVELFNRLTGKALTTRDGWNFMLVLKLVRACQDPEFKLDHYVDLAGYSALAGEEGLKGKAPLTHVPTYETLPKLRSR